jgi:hypothetical protein
MANAKSVDPGVMMKATEALKTSKGTHSWGLICNQFRVSEQIESYP